MGLQYEENCMILTSTVLTDPPTDRRTDGRKGVSIIVCSA